MKSVSGPCKIVSFEEYQRLTPNHGDEEEVIFYTREFYDHKTEDIVSATPLEKICVCQTPENPDLQMIQCDACELVPCQVRAGLPGGC